ncbi:hypothetical protein [Kiloniella laminariae]|uniref:hypothetical protein n=1 Tax=Kiloniella laminariae TaxID=454162 RepID=UPI00039B5A4A|nr:hypothetical protein [Kiloniella laminariae]
MSLGKATAVNAKESNHNVSPVKHCKNNRHNRPRPAMAPVNHHGISCFHPMLMLG